MAGLSMDGHIIMFKLTQTHKTTCTCPAIDSLIVLLFFFLPVMWVFLGLSVTTADGVVRNMCCMLLLTSVDLPARALVLNMKQFNGRYGGCFCYDEGSTSTGDALHRFWPPRSVSPDLRTHQSLLDNAREATNTGIPVYLTTN